MSYLVDTDVIINGLSNHAQDLTLLERLASVGLAVSIISIGELYEGAHYSPNPERHLAGIRRFLAGYRVLQLSDGIMDRFARERATLRRSGQVIADFDLLITATTLVHNLTLVTHNRRHFDRIAGVELYDDDRDA